MIELTPDLPSRLHFFLAQFDLQRGYTERKGWVVPSPLRQDNHPSIWITLAENRIMVRDRTGKPTIDILHALGMTWPDLYAQDDLERLEFEAYLQKLSGGASSITSPDLSSDDVDLRHRVYSAILDQLRLAETHQKQLHDRGMQDDRIVRYQYRTLKIIDRRRLVDHLQSYFGGVAASVPGITSRSGQLSLCDTSGLLIPVRNLDGKIVAFKVRRDHGEPRYRWYGEGDVASAHHPLGFPPASRSVIVTEGELKADLCFGRFDDPVMAVPGMSLWKLALPSLHKMGAKKVVLAFDRSDDAARQSQIDINADAFAEHLGNNGFTVEEMLWEET